MAILGDMVVNLTANTGQFARKMADARMKIGSMQQAVGNNTAVVGQNTRAVDLNVTSLLKTSAALAAVSTAVRTAQRLWAGFTSILRESINQFMKIETLTVQFEVMLGSASKAEQLLSEIRQFAAVTPFQVEDIAQGARVLMAFGFAADEVMNNVKMLGDIAAGSGASIADLARILGQIRGLNRLQAQDAYQLINAGIPIYEALSDVIGKSTAEIQKMQEKGLISFDDVQKALVSMTSEGGQFFNMMEKQSGTLSGLLSTMKDNLSAAAREFGDFLVQTFNLKGGVAGITAAIRDGFVPFLKESLVNLKPLLSSMAELAAVGLRIGAVFAETFGEAFISTLKAIKPFLDDLAEGAKYFADQLRKGADAMRDAKNLVFGGTADAKGKSGIGTMFGLGQLGELFPKTISKKVIEQAFDPGLGFQGAGELGLQPGVTGGRFVPGEAPDAIGEKIAAAITGAGGFTQAGTLSGFINSMDRERTQREQQFAGAAEAGSAEAYSAIVRNIFGRTGPQEKTAKNTEKMVKQQQETNQLIKGSAFNPTVVESLL